MTEEKSPWYEFFLKNNIGSRQATALSEYASRLDGNGVPVIFEMKHFSKILGLEFSLLSRMCGVNSYFYRAFYIKKRRGGVRVIQSPYPKLSYVQGWIKDNILDKNRVNKHAFAYSKGKSHIDNAKCHIGSSELLKIDLENFFDQISISAVQGIFLRLGYTENISFKLAKLCTLRDTLPQGAPSSPAISNIFLYELDNILASYSEINKLTYTRYADDIVFSGERISNESIVDIKKYITSYGLKINEKKSRLVKGAQRKIVTGILVGDTDVRVPKKLKRQYRAQAFNIIKNGFSVFDGSIGKPNPLYIDEVFGKGQYILSVEPWNKKVVEFQSSLRELMKEMSENT